MLLQSSNGLEAYALNTLKAAADYADSIGVKLYNGEFGVWWKEPPSTGGAYTPADIAGMNQLAEKYFSYMNYRGGTVIPWAMSHEGFNDYFLGMVSIDNGTGQLTKRPNFDVMQAHFGDVGSNGKARFSVNGAGNEFYVDSANPPTYGSGFASNGYSQLTLDALAAEGLKSIRYNVGQPGSGGEWLWKNGALNTTAGNTFIDQVENTFNRCQNADIKVMYDALHPGNGQAYATINGQRIVGTATEVGPGYADYLAYLTAIMTHTFLDADGVSTQLMDHPAWEGLDPVNEPQLGNIGDSSNSIEEKRAMYRFFIQQLFNDLRDVNGLNYQGFMIAPAGHYSGMQDLPGNAPQINDPANNYALGVHFYIDSANSGGDRAAIGVYTTHTWAEHLGARTNEPAFSEELTEDNYTPPAEGDRVNKIYNPKFSTNITDNTSVYEADVSATLSSVTPIRPPVGTKAIRVSMTPNGTQPEEWRVKLAINTSAKIDLVENQPITVSVYARPSYARSIKFALEAADGSGYAYSAAVSLADSGNDFVRHSATLLPGATVNDAQLHLLVNDGTGGSIDFTGFMVEDSESLETYFDGDTSAEHQWLGTPNNSESSITPPPVVPPTTSVHVDKDDDEGFQELELKIQINGVWVPAKAKINKDGSFVV